MERIICLIAGYLFGLIQSGYFYGKAHKIDIRNHGSGNSGTTNALRVMGPKAGAVVFLGDFLKSLLPCLMIRVLFRSQPEMIYLLILYTGFGVILGHNYPFYLNFKGGKGIAATAGLIVATDLRMMLLCLVAFVLIVAVTRYVSLGSLVVATIFLIWLFLFGMMGAYGLDQRLLPEFYIVTALISGQAFWRHRANIGRLVRGRENKISFGSGKK
ncbi:MULTISPECIES: glycerol-3-phosphate 1-O-acyltransferase PlsY [Lacrimispora]|jgi:glycerol-3-phosphate acyltransferase PlsY|uniref:Glycerol-3-phosphate acyltransferase n=1 Tax=Lacrimispora sphenoides JCM 1415 TaxID=1297793 RepID=A0ABY1C6V9_9FIRM|nr:MULTISPECIES: glycerol-3-phosphate 1-O-acyltransferase PlsY [Lacrimispora]EXG86870.1 acyl-phosphate glycerol-3-phosphate acyltransferase [Clostridium sp. ASBs410]MDR7812513.1 glycerol-3-phosphate 1-O-acyltransferase PlsY [Lacrimispora sp.]SET75477.1 glycerol-3-phosphate acyltransferase PlsY [[Clostridium] sphenoides JCM 1415]SEU30918.1 glycerol-3-phosphate acyltransferase PlsY [Lacrimispora sphenoides]SUY51013.1 acyl-phosphate glycerol-3-phosphate acyltransferase [Lacrimispora sphenoides]